MQTTVHHYQQHLKNLSHWVQLVKTRHYRRQWPKKEHISEVNKRKKVFLTTNNNQIKDSKTGKQTMYGNNDSSHTTATKCKNNSSNNNIKAFNKAFNSKLQVSLKNSYMNNCSFIELKTIFMELLNKVATLKAKRLRAN